MFLITFRSLLCAWCFLLGLVWRWVYFFLYFPPVLGSLPWGKEEGGRCFCSYKGVCAIRFSSDSKFSSLSFFFYNLLQNTKKYLSSFFSKQKLCYYVISKISFLWLWLIKKYQTSKEEWNSLHLVLPKRQYPLTIPLSSNSVCFWIRYTACIIWNMMDLDLELVMLIMVWIFADWTLPFSSVGDVLRSKTCCGFLYRK